MELGTTSEVIWELVMDEQAGLSEEKKNILCSQSILLADLITGLLVTISAVFWYWKAHIGNTGNKPTQPTTAFSKHNLLGRKFRAFLTTYVPATEARFTPGSAKLMLRAVTYFTVQQEGIMLPGITVGTVFNVFGYISAATIASTVECDPQCPGQVIQCHSW